MPEAGNVRWAVSLGANLGDRLRALRHAVAALEERTSRFRVSSLYETDPVGGVEQPDFLNAVVVGDTETDDAAALAWHLLEVGRRVEAELHRVREVRWGPRTVDVDVLAVGGWRSDDPELIVPHPRAAERAFVLVPWAEVDPDFEVPGVGTVAAALAALPSDETRGVRLAGPWPGPPTHP